MARAPRRRGLPVLLALLWCALLALSPWWLGLACLLAIAAAWLLRPAAMSGGRHALRWGLAGMLFALQRALGGDPLAWLAALLGALAGYTLLAGLDAWLQRRRRRPPAPAPGDDWPALALAPADAPVRIIELQPPAWHPAHAAPVDPRAGDRQARRQVIDGMEIGEVADAVTFSPGGRWFVARVREGGGIVLWDRDRQLRYRLHAWQLGGWHAELPWLVRGADDMPVSLPVALDDAARAGG